ncbi:hypothetical protein [Nubsella zeaxanthinifaciens]|uniref:hypothetical protein n=1 Tax=Nubsella zeaxanthinifaciens TaxID=392412 RepID=UPI0018E55421|nr:hypothetical protein [Nubsella zeaxanthinifaciens]
MTNQTNIKNLITILLITLATTAAAQIKQRNASDFLPKGFVVVNTIKGDLNKDGAEDCVFIIKSTDKNQIITNESGERLDRNRRGIIVLFKKGNQFELATKNHKCFSSENEDGGVYFAPELSVKIKKGNLIIYYSHGRYGYWSYTFRFQNSDFQLIGYDNAYRSNFVSDWVTFDEESINFLNKKKLIREVIKTTKDGKEIFKETSKSVAVSKLIKLSSIKDFDELDMSIF